MHEGTYESGIFKFRIDFAQRFPLNLPVVSFTPLQVFHPLVELSSGRLDIAYFFELNDRAYSDSNYINGKLVRCYDGFCKEMLSKVWSLFHDPLLLTSLHNRAEYIYNQEALDLHR